MILTEAAIAELTNTPAEAWVIVFVPLTSDVPVASRVRALLKAALRAWRMKCVHVGAREPERVAVQKRSRRARRTAGGRSADEVNAGSAGESGPQAKPYALQ